MIGFGQNVNIPDANFKAYLVGNSAINTNGDTEIQISEANIFSGSIDCSFGNISDLTGIEHFTALTFLACRNNQLTNLDLSQNIALEELYCYNNYIVDLDLSQNTNLYRLHCATNYLRRLNVKNGNNINFAQFNATNNIELGCVTVDDAIYSSNWWSSVGANTYFNFSDITCENEMTYVPDDNFEQELIDLGYAYYLDDSIPSFHMNSISQLVVQSLGISDLTGIEDCISMTELYFGNNSVGPNNTITGVLDLSNSINIEKVFGAGYSLGNSITNIIFSSSNNYTLEHLELYGNQIANIDLTKLYALKDLSLGGNPLNSLNLSSNTMLEDLNFGIGGGYPIDSASFVSFPTIPISTIDLSTNTLLQVLSFGNTQITSLDVSNHPDLQSINVGANQLTSININGAINLVGLNCFSNQLTSLDLSTNTILNNLICYNNQLTSLDLSANNNLNNLLCFDNQLTSLDLSNNLLLNYLDCSNNQLTSLDISGNTVSLFYESNPPWGFGNVPQNSLNNPNLYCIDVDSAFMFPYPWTFTNSVLVTDTFSNFSTDCSQAYGCIDTLSCNYNSLSLFSDSSCVYPNSNQQSFSICFLDSVVVGSSVYDTTGNFIDTLANSSGCDSIVYTSVNLLPSTGWQQAFSICDGDSIIVGNSIYNTIGNFVDTLAALNGCDSIVYTDITPNFPTIWYQTYLLCDGESIAVGSSVYDTAGNYIDTLSSANGCDSIVNTYLMIDENTSSNDTLSVGASIVWNGIPLNASGDYSTTLINSVGCDSIVNLNLTVTTTGISEIANNKSNLVKITDMLGQETPYRRNTPLFYIYDDGTVEKRIVIE